MKGVVASAIAALAVVTSAATTSRLTPPVLPLTVRNPYFSTWLPDAREAPWNHWPMFWTGEEVRSQNTSLVQLPSRWGDPDLFVPWLTCW